MSLEKKLVCVEYPGVVRDEARMLQTLGGRESISTVYSESSRRLELRFRPDDVFCQPACGERHNATALLLRVVVRRKKRRPDGLETGQAVESKPTRIECHVVGHVNTVYRFTNLCEYQYLPMQGTPTGAKESIYDQIVPQGFPSYAWLAGDAPLFLPPAAFSRMDTPQPYMYRKEPARKAEPSTPHHIIGRTRQRRIGHAQFVTFDITKAPEQPHAIAMRFLELKFLAGKPYEDIKASFEKRPIWSKNALRVTLGLTSDQLKYLLPTVAYYFVTGPWRNLWSRFGYDPRLETSSRELQTLDYRLRVQGVLRTRVQAKRSYSKYLLPYKSTSAWKPKTSVISKELLASSQDVDDAGASGEREQVGEEYYMLKPNFVPPSRQMFYQYCDLHIPEIEAIIQKLPDIPPGTKCQEKNGWMPASLDEQCREIITRVVNEAVTVETPSAEPNDAEPSTSKAGEEGSGLGDDFDILSSSSGIESSDLEDEDMDTMEQ